MKMRKMLPLVILAVGSLFLLSSCDAMLDAIFSTNQITVDVAVNNTTYYWDWYYGTGSVTLTMTNLTTGAVTSVGSGVTGYSANANHFIFSFPKLKDDTFAFTAYYSGYYSPSAGPNSFFYTPAGAVLTSITMPYSNSGDSTGHSIYLNMYF